MLLSEADMGEVEPELVGTVTQSAYADESADLGMDFETWEIYRCWKQQQSDRFGAGTPAPSIPRSQRQFDGDNWYEYCEPFVG